MNLSNIKLLIKAIATPIILSMILMNTAPVDENNIIAVESALNAFIIVLCSYDERSITKKPVSKIMNV